MIHIEVLLPALAGDGITYKATSTRIYIRRDAIIAVYPTRSQGVHDVVKPFAKTSIRLQEYLEYHTAYTVEQTLKIIQ